jgi:methyltransferase (TIGR00027 family)
VARTDDDSWDLASSVGATATMVAAARAMASKRADAVIDDPFAEPLVRAAGVDLFTKLVSGELAPDDVGSGWMPDVFAARAKFFDDFFAGAWQAGIRQFVILAAGLDARAHRLPWPAGSTLYEIDQPEVIEFKNATLADIAAGPRTEVRTVGIDLRDAWPDALQRRGFDPGDRTAWIAEGLLIGFLPGEVQDRLLDDITALSAPGSRFAVDHLPKPELLAAMMQTTALNWHEHGLHLDFGGLYYVGDRNNAETYLGEHGWDTADRGIDALFGACGFDAARTGSALPTPPEMRYVTATRQ